jgi:hypothetical protein
MLVNWKAKKEGSSMLRCVSVYSTSDLAEVPKPHCTVGTPPWGAGCKVKAGEIGFGLAYRYALRSLGRFAGGRQVEIAEVAA